VQALRPKPAAPPAASQRTFCAPTAPSLRNCREIPQGRRRYDPISALPTAGLLHRTSCGRGQAAVSPCHQVTRSRANHFGAALSQAVPGRPQAHWRASSTNAELPRGHEIGPPPHVKRSAGPAHADRWPKAKVLAKGLLQARPRTHGEARRPPRTDVRPGTAAPATAAHLRRLEG